MDGCVAAFGDLLLAVPVPTFAKRVFIDRRVYQFADGANMGTGSTRWMGGRLRLETRCSLCLSPRLLGGSSWRKHGDRQHAMDGRAAEFGDLPLAVPVPTFAQINLQGCPLAEFVYSGCVGGSRCRWLGDRRWRIGSLRGKRIRRGRIPEFGRRGSVRHRC